MFSDTSSVGSKEHHPTGLSCAPGGSPPPRTSSPPPSRPAASPAARGPRSRAVPGPRPRAAPSPVVPCSGDAIGDQCHSNGHADEGSPARLVSPALHQPHAAGEQERSRRGREAGADPQRWRSASAGRFLPNISMGLNPPCRYIRGLACAVDLVIGFRGHRHRRDPSGACRPALPLSQPSWSRARTATRRQPSSRAVVRALRSWGGCASLGWPLGGGMKGSAVWVPRSPSPGSRVPMSFARRSGLSRG